MPRDVKRLLSPQGKRSGAPTALQIVDASIVALGQIGETGDESVVGSRKIEDERGSSSEIERGGWNEGLGRRRSRPGQGLRALVQINLEIGVSFGRKPCSVVVGKQWVESLARFPRIGHAVAVRVCRWRACGRGEQRIVGRIGIACGFEDTVFRERRDESRVHGVARESAGLGNGAFAQRIRGRIGDARKRVALGARCGESRRVVRRGSGIVVAAVEQGKIPATRVEVHRISNGVDDITSCGKGRSQDLVVPHAVGER